MGNIIAGPVVRLLGVPEEVAPYSVLYLRIYFGGAPFVMLYNFGAAIFRSNGNTRTPLICLLTGGILNVAANLFFVLVLGMDVDGVAIATVLSNVVSSVLLLRILLRDDSVIRLYPDMLRLDRMLLGQMIRIGLPAALQSTVFSISNLCVQTAINSLGSDVMAASSAAFNIKVFIFFIINAFTQTLVTFVGQNYGAGEYARCRVVVRKTLIVSWCIAMAASILMYSETLNVFMDNLSGAMRGLGKSLIPALVTLIGVCGTRITWVFTGFRVYHTFLSLMLVFPVNWGISAVIITFMYIRTRNKMLPVSTEAGAVTHETE